MLKFLCDQMLADLGKWLRIAGYDTLIAESGQKDEEIYRIALQQNRILLTKDRHFLEINDSSNVLFLDTKGLNEHAKKLKSELKLDWTFHPFSRCLKCNTELQEIEKEKIADLLFQQVKENQDVFKICPKCSKIYWEGSHAKDMLKTLHQWKRG